MSCVIFEETTYTLADGESVLDALLRAGKEIPNGCRAGACQSCLMVSDDQIPTTAQQGLNESQKQLGYFLSCQCKPNDVISVKKPDNIAKTPAVVIDKAPYNDSVIKVTLKSDIQFKPGQYFTLWKDDKIARSYSTASLCDHSQSIDFHIKKIDNGIFSSWLDEQVIQGDQINIQGPLGQCFYNCTDSEQPILMAAIGTGLAPIIGILKDALTQDHTGPIDLLVGARTATNFYYEKELKEIAQQHNNVSVHWVAQSAEKSAYLQADIYEYSKALHPSTQGYKIYLCGAESFVKKMKKQCFLSGASMSDIHADAFVAFGG